MNVINAIAELKEAEDYGCGDYINLCALDEAIAALEKQIPKKPDYWGDGIDNDGNIIYDQAKCPICGHDFEYGINEWGSAYCQDCGQALDWSDTE